MKTTPITEGEPIEARELAAATPDATQEAVAGSITARGGSGSAPAAIDPTTTGMTALRTQDASAMKLWTVKGPKEQESTLSGVFMQDSARVVILQQFPDGRHVVYDKAAS